MSFEEVKEALIEQLKPLLMEPEFPEFFDQLTSTESNTNRFLLKMELNRLASTCNRIIDLRDKTDLPCEPLVFKKQTHLLDAPSKQAFLESVSRYHQQYTIGVYEEVLNSHKQRLKDKKQSSVNTDDQNDYSVPGIILGTYFNRCEERMNYSIHITAFQSGKNELKGTTLDLSVGGARIRIPKKHGFDTTQPILVKLIEINEEYYYKDLHQGIEYQIVDVESNHEHCIMRLKRISGSEDLSQILANLIKGFKYRYKVDVNEVYTNSLALGYERHYLPHYRHLALFVNATNHSVSHGLLGAENQCIKNYFLNEKEICQLSKMLTPERIQSHNADIENFDHSLIYCFKHVVNEKVYFYSASLFELKQHNLQHLFFRFGSQKASWRIFQIAAKTINHSLSYKAAILPGDERQYTPLTEKQLSQLSHVINLIDLTHKDSKDDYKSWISTGNANQLKLFAQTKATKSDIKYISLNFTERRQESRYSFKTQIEMTQDKKSITGMSVDISTKGFQVTLENDCDFELNTPITVALPKLQSLAGKTQLTALPYKLVKKRRKGRVLHLTAMINHAPHVGVEFLNRLIIHNQDKLTRLTQSDDDIKELSDGLKNLLMRNLPSTLFFIEKTTKSAKLSMLGLSKNANLINDLFTNDTLQKLEFNLAPLFAGGLFKSDLLPKIRKAKSSQEMHSIDIFVRLSIQSRAQFEVKFVPVSEFNNSEEKHNFISLSQKLGKFIAIRVLFGATGKPDLKYIEQEREYISVHAAHKAKNLDEKLWQTVGVGELLDCTAETINRYFYK
ncbi:PilZ domain-containing protein [Parashewanella spongiae]|uniref:PilZ domain-containing protein n=1 Tax=Parashewanella spongiae TaxID=342950 RepID=A0A3A6TEH9_9GAMM|nr:PilZ domain-containing protein [Parashewanella spongiae]MCL1079802.1 PilZ domain-containing protein [Parashewanella spongiae]RJY06804.1 PilZ domain-containing protein [Parashewanella spongiae]